MEEPEKFQRKLPNQEIDYIKIGKILISRWYWIAATVTITSLIAYTYLWYTPKTYSTGGTLKVEEKKSEVSDLISVMAVPDRGPSKIQSIISILQSRNVMLSAVKDMDYPIKSKYYIEKEKLANLLMMFAVVSFPVSIVFLRVPGLVQFYYQLNSLSFIAGTLALAFAIPLKKIGNTLICFFFYCFNFYQALISGFKEPIIISVLVLGIFLYPSYKKAVAGIFIPALLLLFMFLPTYNRIFRQNAWSGEASADEATQLALDAALNGNSDDGDDSNWGFLVYRLSEIDMFIKFTQSTPKNVDFYGTTLLKQSGIALVPRFFWPDKPSTEDLIMERVYDAGVVNRASTVSAKPAYIVDAYLSYGTLGVFLAMIAYGAVAQLISIKAEKLFGGYILGTALIFSGLFQNMWRGLSFEFIVNTVFWSYVTMLIVHKILTVSNILKEI